MKQDNTQRGSISGALVGFIALIILVLVGVGVWWHQKDSTPTVATTMNTTESTAPSNTVAYGYETVPVVSTTTTYVTKTVYKPATQVAAPILAVNYPAGTTFHNSTYGLTLHLPSNFAGYRSYITTGGPANLPGTARIHFVAPGESSDAFVVNVFNKQQWNQIRTQENLAHLNVNDLGEGTYLGENYTWIYSSNVYAHPEVNSALRGAVFY